MQYTIEEDVDGTWCVVDVNTRAPATLVIGYAVGFNRTDASIVCHQLNVSAALIAEARAARALAAEPVAEAA
jgi:hypothetical protein